MRWNIQRFVFDEKKQTLEHRDQHETLEPLVAEVLTYFCHHADEVISREQLIDEVWKGQAVTDNAVSRVIAKLRKHFDDDPKQPAYITTYPKKGYRFIATIEKIETIQLPQHRRSWLWFLIAICAGLVIWAFWYGSRSRPKLNPSPVQTVALTRGGGREVLPEVSPDGRFLAYSTQDNNNMRLFLKDLTHQRQVEIGNENGWSGPASWSPDGQQLVYLNSTTTESVYYLLDVDGLEVVSRRIVHKSPQGSFGKMIFSRKPSIFYFSETDSYSAPYSIYKLDAKSGEVRRLSQPELVLGGNSQFDLHPTQNKLVISAPNTHQWLDIYELDLDGDQLDFLFQVKEYVCCPIWSHDGERIAMIGEYPSHGIISFNLKGEDRQSVVQTPHRIEPPLRFPNGKDYVFAGGFYNRDIYFYDFEGRSSVAIEDSSVDDRLPRVSPDGSQLSFISDRSQREEIWLFSMEERTSRKLTQFKEHPYFFDVQFSPDGQFLAAMTINEIFLVTVNTGEYRKINIPQQHMQLLSWKDSQNLAFSLKTNHSWQVHLLDLRSDSLTSEGTDLFVQFRPKTEDRLWIAKDGVLYSDRGSSEISHQDIIYDRGLAAQKVGDSFYYLREKGQEIAMILRNLKTSNEEELFVLDRGTRFSVSEKGIYYEQLTRIEGDIYRTESQ